MPTIEDLKTKYTLIAIDIGERASSTFIQAFAGALLVNGMNAESAAMAGAAAVLSLIKGLAATRVNKKGTASLTV
jgi:hypothetical protein